MKGIFITGTGTDVGKTFITALIVKKMRQDAEVNCGYYKAALSGAEVIVGENGERKLVAGDADYVYKTAGIKGEPNDSVSYMFEEAVSPHLASRINNVKISMDKIKQDFNNIKSTYDYIVVEGSGGVICPIYEGRGSNERIMLEDIVRELGLSVILVADAGLGTINSTILTLDYLKRKNIKVNGIILNNYNEKNIIHADNKEYLSKILNIEIYTCITDCENINISPENLKDMFEEI